MDITVLKQTEFLSKRLKTNHKHLKSNSRIRRAWVLGRMHLTDALHADVSLSTPSVSPSEAGRAGRVWSTLAVIGILGEVLGAGAGSWLAGSSLLLREYV